MSIATKTVTADEADLRLDRWFRRHFPSATQGVIQKLCRTGQIRVDGKRVETNLRLAAGMSVRVPPLPPSTPVVAERPAPVFDPLLEQEMSKLVLYRDDHVIVLNKPFGVPSQGGP
jgi:23S rRNA pseudouridine955/2504/2580 synthase